MASHAIANLALTVLFVKITSMNASEIRVKTENVSTVSTPTNVNVIRAGHPTVATRRYLVKIAIRIFDANQILANMEVYAKLRLMDRIIRVIVIMEIGPGLCVQWVSELRKI